MVTRTLNTTFPAELRVQLWVDTTGAGLVGVPVGDGLGVGVGDVVVGRGVVVVVGRVVVVVVGRGVVVEGLGDVVVVGRGDVVSDGMEVVGRVDDVVVPGAGGNGKGAANPGVGPATPSSGTTRGVFWRADLSACVVS